MILVEELELYKALSGERDGCFYIDKKSRIGSVREFLGWWKSVLASRIFPL